LGIVRVDPDLLIVIATRRAADGGPGEPAVLGPPEHGRRTVDDVVVLRIDRNRRQVAPADARERPVVGGATGDAGSVDERPMLARVARLVEADDPAAEADGCGSDARSRSGDGRVEELR